MNTINKNVVFVNIMLEVLLGISAVLHYYSSSFELYSSCALNLRCVF